MNRKILSRFRKKLSSRRDFLIKLVSNNETESIASTGYAPENQVEEMISQHQHALDKIELGEFGKCLKCSGEVEPERLELDFTSSVCLDHYSEKQIRELEQDLELAARVQRHLLPYSIPVLPGVQIAAQTLPSKIVGGDYFDFYAYPDGSQGFAIADVMGKGLAASMLMSNLQASLRILGPEFDQLDRLATRLNELFRFNIKLISFISAFLGRIDLRSKKLHYCNAGHHPALWWDTKSGSLHSLKPTGPAIGLTRNAEYSLDEIPVSSGDLILFYTDGLIEARNKRGEEFGEEKLIKMIGKYHGYSAGNFLKKLQETAKTHAGTFDDDVTMMVLKF